ncbi:MAG: methionyl-tRNA formyltransferase [Deltaproteobacteria bacterium]|nr:methionyl-tRNA formyltransferase [Deltaproteobacteria bacterium]
MARIVFMGSPEIAVPSLKALHAAGHEIAAVVTQPDRPKGRGQVLTAPAVKAAAEALGLPVRQPEKIRTPEFAEELRELRPELIAVVAYGKILPPEVLKIPEICCVNLHFSLLPKYRGAACVAYALRNGDAESGVTTIVMEAGLDTGPILMQWSELIRPDDTAGSLSERLAVLGAEQLVRTVEALERGTVHPTPQAEAEASYAPLLKKEEGRIDWNRPAAEIFNRYRGLSPWPGVYGFLEGKRVIFTELRPVAGAAAGPPGALRRGPLGELWVDCGAGSLEISRLKPEGKSVLSAEDFMRGLQGKTPLRFE